jgi:hypothetical protein
LVYPGAMPTFFPSLAALETFLRSLHTLSCPVCGAGGTYKRHGYIRGFVSVLQHGIRAWRIYCNPRRGGCGRAPSLRLAESLHHRCMDAGLLAAFLSALLRGLSTKAAWEASGCRLSLDRAYHLLGLLRRGLPALRARLAARSPPPIPTSLTTTPLLQTVQHLHAAFAASPVRAFQLHFQSPFLSP